MKPNDLKKRRLITLTTIISAIALIAIITVFLILDGKKSATVNILVAPSQATVKINGKTYKSRQTIKVEPGTKSVTLQADGFISQQFDLETTKNNITYLYVILQPTAENANWYDDHPEENNRLGIISDYLAAQEQAAYLAKYPIISVLPISVVDFDQKANTWTEYRIDYGKFDDCQSDFCLKITDTSGGNYEKALQEITKRGYDPTKYQIIYDYTPVEKINQSTLDKIHALYN